MVNVRLCEKVSLAFLVLKASIRGSNSKTFQHLWQKLTNKSDFETFLGGEKKIETPRQLCERPRVQDVHNH